MEKYFKYKDKNWQKGGNIEYNFCSLWINKEKKDISRQTIETIDKFAKLIDKYGKKLKFYVDFSMAQNIDDLKCLSTKIDIINIRDAMQILYPVEHDFKDNFINQSQLFDKRTVIREDININHLIHSTLHPDVPLWTRIDFAKPIVILHDMLDKSENYCCIYSDLDLMDYDLYEQYLQEKTNYDKRELSKVFKNKFRGIYDLLNWYHTGVNIFQIESEFEDKMPLQQYKNHIIQLVNIYNKQIANNIDVDIHILENLRHDLLLSNDKYQQCIKIYDDLIGDIMKIAVKKRQYDDNYTAYKEKRNLNCISPKVKTLDEYTIFTQEIKDMLDIYGIIAQGSSLPSNSENNFYIVKNNAKIKQLISDIFIKETAYCVNFLMKYRKNQYNKNILEHIINNKYCQRVLEREQLFKEAIDIYLQLFKKITFYMTSGYHYSFSLDVRKINDEAYLDSIFGIEYHWSTQWNWCLWNQVFNTTSKEYDTIPHEITQPVKFINTICMITEKSKFADA
jgi:hypothetical protein